MKKIILSLCSAIMAFGLTCVGHADLIIDGTNNAAWPASGDANGIMSYTSAANDPTTVLPAGGYVRIGTGNEGEGLASLDMISGTLTLDCSMYGAIVGQGGGDGALVVDGGALTWDATGAFEQYFFIGNSGSTGVVTVNEGTFTLNTDTLIIGRDASGIGTLNINGGVMTCSATTFGLGIGGSPDNTTSGILSFGSGNGVLIFTNNLSTIAFGNSGGANYINFQSGSGGKLEIYGWTQAQFAALVAAGNVCINGVTTTTTNLFGYVNANGTGIFGLAAGSPLRFSGTQATTNGYVMNGSGGPANGVYYLLSSTNPALPLASWMRVQTNYFDASGNFDITDASATNSAYRFYRLQTP